MTTTYEIRRTLDVRPDEYDSRRGWLYESGISTLKEAIHTAEARCHLGYPVRVVEVTADVSRCVWIRS